MPDPLAKLLIAVLSLMLPERLEKLERETHPEFIANRKNILSKWDPLFGDRETELVIIGQAMNQDRIKREMEQCLLTDEELENWTEDTDLHFADPWPE